MELLSKVGEFQVIRDWGQSSERYPCSMGQERFWFLEQLDPGNPALNVAVRVQVDGVLRREELAAAWEVLLARHASLRTCFEAVNGEPQQIVTDFARLKIPVVDLSGLSAADAKIKLDQIGKVEAVTPFSLSSAPLIRVTLVMLGPASSVVLLTVHHIVCDGWAIGILSNEMAELCAGLQKGKMPILPPLELDYGEFTLQQREWLLSDPLEAEADYWREKLARFSRFELPTDFPRPKTPAVNGHIQSVMLAKDLTNALTDLGHRHDATLFMTSLAALALLLQRQSGEDDITVGTQILGRDDVEVENIVGLFINTIVIRCDLAGDPSFTELLDRVRDTVFDALEYRNLPIERLFEIAGAERDLSRNPLFSVNFIFQKAFIGVHRFDDISFHCIPSMSAGALYDLNFFMVERDEGWRLSCEYNTDLFAPATIAGLLDRFHIILREIVRDAGRPIATIPVISGLDRARLVVENNHTEMAYPADLTIVDLIAAQTKKTPDATAIVCGDEHMTFQRLDERSTLLAGVLRAQTGGKQGQIGVFLERSCDLVVALLAVLKSGNAYVPLDPVLGHERLDHVVRDAGLMAMVTHSKLVSRIDVPVPLVLTDKLTQASVSGRAEPGSGPTPESLAYVIYTSGSTGLPKGVRIQHRALTNLLCAMRQSPGLTARDTLVSVTTVSFDIAALEIFLPLMTGAKLVIAREDDVVDGRALWRLMQQHRASCLQATPSTWQLLLLAGWRGDPELKMLCGGEAMPAALAEKLLLCGGELWNMYGPTETTIWSSIHQVQSSDKGISIGRPIANTQFYVLDGRGELSPPGAIGELYIGGDGVAAGYHNLPQLTQERFVPDKFRDVAGARLYRTGDLVRMNVHGNFEYLHRADNQVKVRGFRIELGEVEAALQRLPAIAEAAAFVQKNAEGDHSLMALVVPKDAKPLDLDFLHTALANRLPPYMVPSNIFTTAALPRTPNGKIDRKALASAAPAPVAAVPREQEGPVSPTEQRLIPLWEAVLNTRGVTPESNFFRLGGHSLLAARLLARIADEFGRRIPLTMLFKAPTLRVLAHWLDIGAERPLDFRRIVTFSPLGKKPPIIVVHNTGYFENLARAIDEEQPMVALQVIDPSRKQEALPTNFQALATEYVDLIEHLHPEGPCTLIGWCVGGVLAYEVAQQLNARGRDVSHLVMLQSWEPYYVRRLPPVAAKIADYSFRLQTVGSETKNLLKGRRPWRQYLERRPTLAKIARIFGLVPDAETWARERHEAHSDEERHDALMQNYMMRLSRDYAAPPYAGRTTIVRARHDPAGWGLDKLFGWGNLLQGSKSLISVAGNHTGMLQVPAVTQIAAALGSERAVTRE
ncbi:non-ribosomal peptide synthetase [Methylovirgula sp. 4M-Z18]|uniref:non-ribosomal peptide synthetase n=1 Tax=Methylovirgula sp. 4M-Z18 TaxID=2293567 RepID=UPI000E2FA144|nr:non-ribosomal peptide synthetase [Methylovirgula sp. 4M-Z18]RFB75517.1 amino acid adenylation domain-containing protein [Methylovirgula sp. 4M-Z18]